MTSALEQDLRKALAGEVRFDRATRALYATDASVYQIEPLGVVLPRSRDDVEAAVTVAARHGVPITPARRRHLAGRAVDRRRPRRRHLEVPEPRAGGGSRRAHRARRAGPGARRPERRRSSRTVCASRPMSAPSSRATVGGMMANNSSGARSVIYGKTGDHVRTQQVVLADGTTAELAPLSGAALAAARARRLAAGARLSRRAGAGRGPRRRDRRALPEGDAARRRLRARRLRRSGRRRSISRASWWARKARSASSPRPPSAWCRCRPPRRS